MRRKCLISLMALAATTIVGCGTTAPLPAASTAVAPQTGKVEANASSAVKRRLIAELQRQYPYAKVTLEYISDYANGGEYRFEASVDGRRISGSYDDVTGRIRLGSQPGSGDLASVKRTIISELERRYAYARVTLEYVSDYPSNGVYKFTARVDGRTFEGTYDSFTREVRLYGEPGSGNLAQVKRTIIAEVERQYPYARVTLEYVSDYPSGGIYNFRALVDGRVVTGTYDSYSGRVKINGGGGGYPTTPQEGLVRALQDLYPGASVRIGGMDKSSYGSYDFYAWVDGRKVFGNYDPSSGRVTLQK